MAQHAQDIVDRAMALIFGDLIPLTGAAHDPRGPEACAACRAVHDALRLRQDASGLRRRHVAPAAKKATTRPRRPRGGAPEAPETPAAAVPPETTVGHTERVESVQQRHETRTGEGLPIEEAEARLASATAT